MAIQADCEVAGGLVAKDAYYRIAPISIHRSADGSESGEYTVAAFVNKAAVGKEPLWRAVYKIASLDITKPILDQLYADLNAKIASSQKAVADAADATAAQQKAAAEAMEVAAGKVARGEVDENSDEAKAQAARLEMMHKWVYSPVGSADFVPIAGAFTAV